MLKLQFSIASILCFVLSFTCHASEQGTWTSASAYKGTCVNAHDLHGNLQTVLKKSS